MCEILGIFTVWNSRYMAGKFLVGQLRQSAVVIGSTVYRLCNSAAYSGLRPGPRWGSSRRSPRPHSRLGRVTPPPQEASFLGLPVTVSCSSVDVTVRCAGPPRGPGPFQRTLSGRFSPLRSAPAHLVFRPLRSVFRSAHAPLTCSAGCRQSPAQLTNLPYCEM